MAGMVALLLAHQAAAAAAAEQWTLLPFLRALLPFSCTTSHDSLVVADNERLFQRIHKTALDGEALAETTTFSLWLP